MRKFLLTVGAVIYAGAASPGFAATNNLEPAVDFDELRTLIQQHLPGVTKTDLDQSGVQGLLHGFRGKVRLVASPITGAETRPPLTRSVVYDGGIGYLRATEVAPDLDRDFVARCQALNATNKLKGVVLDLRFAAGDDYAAAAAVADLFIPDEKDLLDWGNGMRRSITKTNALAWPLVVLVNGETTGAAEALAALVREAGVGLILGGRTVGAAMTAKEFTLSNGQRVRIATDSVKLPGGAPLAPTGLTPDILVNTTPAEEKLYWNDPYGPALATLATTNGTSAATNRVVRRVRTTEADLVRARKQGLDADEDSAPRREPEPEARVIRDPALGRAVDLLKGLAVVRRNP